MKQKEEPTQTAAKRRLRLRAAGLALLLLLLLGLSLGWAYSPWRSEIDPTQLLPKLQRLGQWMGPWAMAALMTLALVLAVPLMLLTVLALAALGPTNGLLCTLAAGVAAASLSHGIGHCLGHAALQALAGPRLQQLSQALARRGLIAVILIRWLPIAPFAIVNMVAGASHIRLRDMMLGTLLGMLPATLALAFFMDQLMHALESAQASDAWRLLAGLTLLGVAAWLLRRWAARRQA